MINKGQQRLFGKKSFSAKAKMPEPDY